MGEAAYTAMQEIAGQIIASNDRDGARSHLSHCRKFGEDAHRAAGMVMRFLGIDVIDSADGHTHRDGHLIKDHAGNVVGASVPVLGNIYDTRDHVVTEDER